MGTREHRIETIPWKDSEILILTDLSCCCLQKPVRKNLYFNSKFNDDSHSQFFSLCFWIFIFCIIQRLLSSSCSYCCHSSLFSTGFDDSSLLLSSALYHIPLLTHSLFYFILPDHMHIFWIDFKSNFDELLINF